MAVISGLESKKPILVRKSKASRSCVSGLSRSLTALALKYPQSRYSLSGIVSILAGSADRQRTS